MPPLHRGVVRPPRAPPRRSFAHGDDLVDALLLTVPETQRRLRLGRNKIYELLSTGQLESVRIGRARRIVAASVDSLAARLLEQQQ